jgi:hypothetical protein
MGPTQCSHCSGTVTVAAGVATEATPGVRVASYNPGLFRYRHGPGRLKFNLRPASLTAGRRRVRVRTHSRPGMLQLRRAQRTARPGAVTVSDRGYCQAEPTFSVTAGVLRPRRGPA